MRTVAADPAGCPSRFRRNVNAAKLPVGRLAYAGASRRTPPVTADAELPVFDETADGETVVIGSRILPTDRVEIGMIRRQCTSDYKLAPIRRKVWELVALAGRRSPEVAIVEQWIGILLDEAIRMPDTALAAAQESGMRMVWRISANNTAVSPTAFASSIAVTGSYAKSVVMRRAFP